MSVVSAANQLLRS